MTFGPDPMPSGVPFPVGSVRGVGAAELDDFVGDVSFTVDSPLRVAEVKGIGAQTVDGVRVTEKDAGNGKDVRVWTVRRADGGRFTAEVASAASLS